jgi:hypothetical protein
VPFLHNFGAMADRYSSSACGLRPARGIESAAQVVAARELIPSVPFAA